MSHLSSRPATKWALSFALAAGLAFGAGAVAYAQPGDANYQAQAQDYQAKQDQYNAQTQAYEAKKGAYENQKDAYAQQRAGYRASQDVYAEQQRLYALGRAEYEARFGAGSYDVYTRTHTTTTTTISPAGTVESRTKTTVIEH
jgi:uncharacterized protein HemX